MSSPHLDHPDDDQPSDPLWPVHLALAAWAALVAGMVVALGGFDDPRLWHNGSVRLITVAATFGLLIWAVRTIQPRRSARLKLAVVASLLAHTLLVAVLYRHRLQINIEPAAALAREADLPQEPPRRIEYGLEYRQHVADRDPFEQPLATAVPMPPPSLPAAFPPAARSADAPPIGLPDESVRRTIVSVESPSRTRLTALAAPAALPTEPIELPELDSADDRHTTADGDASRLAPSPEAAQLTRAEAPPWTPSTASLSAGALDLARLPSELGRVSFATGNHAIEPMLPVAKETRPLPAPDPTARRPSPAFARRLERHQPGRDARIPSAGSGRIGPLAEAAIERGLEYLARVQRDDGRWEFGHVGLPAGTPHRAEQPSIQADAAATGLALLAFLGAGYDHLDGRYRYSVEQGIDYLRGVQAPSGELFPEAGQAVGQVTRFYSHGIATLALCEAYGMTGDSELRAPAQAALDYLARTQHPELGGWRYAVGMNADLSVTGWQLLALRSGELAGLNVPRETLRRLRDCLEQCRDEEGEQALFRYNPWASPTDPRTRHGRQPSTVMTAVGLLMQLHLDGDRDSPRTRAAARHLLANLPHDGDSPEVALTGTTGNPRRDTYYWYYATQALYFIGGDDWQTWRDRLFPLLVQSQVTTGRLAGSWDPRGPAPDKWGSYGGRLYVTTMNLLSLEIEHRHLPLVDQSARTAESERLRVRQ